VYIAGGRHASRQVVEASVVAAAEGPGVPAVESVQLRTLACVQEQGGDSKGAGGPGPNDQHTWQPRASHAAP
jgi:hypothetical protein